ncbi:hypothetical protein L1887_20611 [Cichorium endivia]|nr:hypothetical protein L1887_20611 [Cichorium endivia]
MFTPDQKSTHKFMTPIGFDVLWSSGGDSSFTLSSDSESESSMSINKLLISPINDDAIKEQVSNLKLVISESNLKIKTMGEKLSTANDEITKVKHELSNKSIELGCIQEEMALLQIHIDSQKAKILELQEEVNLCVADITVRDDQITEIKTKVNQSMSEISLLKTTYSAKEDIWNDEVKRSKTEVSEKCQLIDDLNRKHDAVMSEREMELKHSSILFEPRCVHGTI